MVREKFAVRLTPEQRDQLERMVRAGKSSARVTTRARILLKTDEGWTAPKVVRASCPCSRRMMRLSAMLYPCRMPSPAVSMGIGSYPPPSSRSPAMRDP